MTVPIAFIICTEPGRLEGQSLLLAESIRKFCGNLKDTPIYSFHPRVGEPISIQTRTAFAALGVVHHQIPINTDFHDYYLANKPLVCAYAEKNIDAEILVFLDSDKCFFSEPKEFLLPPGYNIALRPEYGKSIGSNGVKDRQEDYWQRLYEAVGVRQEIFVTTPIGNKKIRGYWNSGTVVVRRIAGIFSAWKDNFVKVMSMKIYPRQGNYFTEQAVLSATVCALESNILNLSFSYSYPLPLHNKLVKNAQIDNFDKFVSIHYFNMFFYQDWEKKLDNLRQLNKNSHKYQWLCAAVSRHNMPHLSVMHRHVLNLRKIEAKLKKIHLNINLSNWVEKKL